MPSTTWSTTDLLNATLSSTNLMATATGAGGIRAAVGQTTGKYYFEFTPNLFNSGNNGFGIANASATLSSMGGTPTNAVMVYRVGGPIWINNVNTGSTIGNLESGWTFGIALDLDNYMIWIRRAPSGNWNGSGTANPATNTGGLSIASIASSSVAVFPAAAFGASSQRTTANFGLTPFCGAVPSGFIAGFPTSSLGPQVNSAWSTTDKTAPTLIQASNLGVIFGATAEGVRSAAYRNAGKFYFEIVGSSWFKPNTGIGVGNGGAVLTTVATTPTNAILVYSGGSIYSNGSIVSGAGLGGRSAGDTIAIALDLDNRLIWFRVAPSGNWNNSGTANPATGVGGISTGGLFGGASSAYALIATDAGADEDGAVANFGDSPFAGTVPSGFTAGWPAIPPRATHLNWRINVSANNSSSNIAIAEIEMRATVGGADQCTGGTATHSATFGAGYEADKAFDNNLATMWNRFGFGWVRYQFAAPVKVVEYTVAARNDTFLNDSPKDWTLEYSDDGLAWTVAHTVTGQTGWTTSQVRTFSFTPPPVVTWDAANKNAAIALSNSNLTATSSAGSGSVNAAVIATAPIPATGKSYFEVTVSGTVGQYLSVGVMNGSSSTSANIAATNGIAFVNNFAGASSNLYLNGSSYASSLPSLVSGQTVRVAVDRASNKLWWAINNNTWSGAAVWMGDGTTSNDPSTGTGGANIASLTGTIYPAISSAWTGDVAVLNDGMLPFAYAIPTGFAAISNPVPTANGTWNPADKGAQITLSSGDLVATSSGASTPWVRATNGKRYGKYYWEVTATTWAQASTAHGLASSAWTGASGSGVGLCGVNFFGNIFLNGVSAGISLSGTGTGAVVCVAYDVGAQLAWWRIGPSGQWNASGTANPATGIGGLATGLNGTAAPAFFGSNAGEVASANFGDGAFSGTVPSGFTAGWPTASPSTTWNLSDKATVVNLDNGNLTATSSAARGTVRATDRQAVGKFYWEVVLDIGTSVDTAIGITTSTFDLTSGLAFQVPQAIGCACVNRSGQISVEGAVTGTSFGTLANGTAVCIAVDATSRLIWFRLGSGGNWNNVATANPATGVGGIAITSGRGIPIYPAATLGATNDRVTANFGETTFAGVVPSGFTEGWPPGALIGNNALATQAAVEEWFAPTPDAQVTQAAVEQWQQLWPDAQLTQIAAEHWLRTNPDAQVTQMLLEHWAAVDAPPLWATQVAIEHWGSGSAAVRLAMTQAAIEHWAAGAAVTSVPAIGPMITTIF